MKSSRDRILTTHVGSLPRPHDLLELLEAEDQGRGPDPDKLRSAKRKAVCEIVKQQIDNGVDIVSDGEMGKLSYTIYVKHRLDGVQDGGPPLDMQDGRPRGPKDMQEHPGYAKWRESLRDMPGTRYTPPQVTSRISYGSRAPLEEDIANLTTATAEAVPVEAFVNTASPGLLPSFVRDAFYKNEEAYVADLADAMKFEYDAIHAAGFLVQVDCPDLAMSRHIAYQDKSDAEFLKIAERNVEALNHACRDIPSDRLRMHICWGNYPGPHTHDIAVSKIVNVVVKAKPQAILFEAANSRHAHEYEDWASARIPDDKILIPGVIDSTDNFVEHPRLVAQRLKKFAEIVGRERVIAGSDCGFSTVAGMIRTYPSVTWAKLRSMSEGAEMASRDLWKSSGITRF